MLRKIFRSYFLLVTRQKRQKPVCSPCCAASTMASTSDQNHSNGDTDKGERKEPPQGGVLFRSKKRSKKARTKLQFKEEDNNAAENEEPEMTVSEMTILKEAQELREQTRIAALTAKQRVHRSKSRDEEVAKQEPDDPIGLKESFAVEKSSHIAEERMSRYIEERMAEKFKDRRRHDSDGKTHAEDEVFAIPERLKVGEKPLYDPGEGLPAAGVEEVALPDEVRMRNEEETRRARGEVLKRRAAAAAKEMNHIPGNVSANFAKHRSEWMKDNATRFGDDEAKHRTEHADDKQDKPVGQDMTKRRRYQTASDAAVADRFRKRWKR